MAQMSMKFRAFCGSQALFTSFIKFYSESDLSISHSDNLFKIIFKFVFSYMCV